MVSTHDCMNDLLVEKGGTITVAPELPAITSQRSKNAAPSCPNVDVPTSAGAMEIGWWCSPQDRGCRRDA